MRIILLILISISISGCHRSITELVKLNRNASKQEVLAAIGTPDIARGAQGNIDVWEYHLAQPGYIWSYDTYWVQFTDDRVSQWGKAGDWQRTPDQINEIRFR